MQDKSFINKSHFKLYDSVIPVFRLLCVVILIGVIIYKKGLGYNEKGFSFILLYLIYALILLFFKNIRVIIVLKYPFIIGICETLIVTYGIGNTGGAGSPFYYSYILMIAFFGMVHNLKYSLIVSSFCGSCFIGILILSGEKISFDIIIKFLFLFAVFIGLINERINKYNIKMAVSDQLTSLYNRQYFYGELENILTHSEEHKLLISLVIIDVNDFKMINDKYGHFQGDRILTEIGALIKKHIRKGDIAARYGGDEFVILLPDADKNKAKDFCRQLQEAIRDNITNGVTVSVGFATYPNDGESMENLFHAADMAMYQAKMRKGDIHKKLNEYMI